MRQKMRAVCVGTRAANGQAGSPIRFTAATPGIKRDGKDLNMMDFSLDSYRKNPVVLWAHNYMGSRLPIGRARVEVSPERLLADVVFDQEDDFARQVENKYRGGFLHAVSVGWDEVRVDGRVRLDLLDISAVAVPADPDATMERFMAKSFERRYGRKPTERDRLKGILARVRRMQDAQARDRVRGRVRKVLGEILLGR